MSKRRKQVDRGDIIIIHDLDLNPRYAQVSWASTYYKDVIQILFLSNYDPESENIEINYQGPSYFTSAKIVRSGDWEKIGSAPCSTSPNPPIFYSAGDIWQGDEVVRKATSEDKNSIIKLKVSGKKLVEKYATNT